MALWSAYATRHSPADAGPAWQLLQEAGFISDGAAAPDADRVLGLTGLLGKVSTVVFTEPSLSAGARVSNIYVGEPLPLLQR